MAKVTLSLVLYTAEMVYDVCNKMYLSGESKIAGAVPDGATAGVPSELGGRLMQPVADGGEAYQIKREVVNAIQHLRGELSEYLSDNLSTADNRIPSEVENGGQITLTLSIPSNFDRTQTRAISAAMHDYVVNYAAARWCLLTNKSDLAEYQRLADFALGALQRSVHERVRPTAPSNYSSN